MTQQETQRLETLQAQVDEHKKQGILSRISLPAALAAALTAVTSFLFSAKLGLTGSLIGAGIGAVVSTIASQVYKAMIDDSIVMVHDISEQVHEIVEEQQATRDLSGIDKTLIRPLPPELAREVQEATGTPIAPEALREEAARRHAKSLMLRTFAVAIITALLALAGYAAVVTVATRGKGIGPTSFEQVTLPEPKKDATETQPKAETETEKPTDTTEDNGHTTTPAEEQTKPQTPEEENVTPTDEQATPTDQPVTQPEETTTPTTDESQTQTEPAPEEVVEETPTEPEAPAADPTATGETDSAA